MHPNHQRQRGQFIEVYSTVIRACALSQKMILSSELLAGCVKTVRSDAASLINCIHWLVTLVAWNLHLVVLDNVLLDDGLTSAKSGRLSEGVIIELSLWNEAIVTWDVSRGFRCSNSELMVLISCHLSFYG